MACTKRISEVLLEPVIFKIPPPPKKKKKKKKKSRSWVRSKFRVTQGTHDSYFLFKINRTIHSWNTATLNFDLKCHECGQSSVKVTHSGSPQILLTHIPFIPCQSSIPTNYHITYSFRSMSISSPIHEIRLFHNLTLKSKLKVMPGDVERCQESKLKFVCIYRFLQHSVHAAETTVL